MYYGVSIVNDVSKLYLISRLSVNKQYTVRAKCVWRTDHACKLEVCTTGMWKLTSDKRHGRWNSSFISKVDTLHVFSITDMFGYGNNWSFVNDLMLSTAFYIITKPKCVRRVTYDRNFLLHWMNSPDDIALLLAPVMFRKYILNNWLVRFLLCFSSVICWWNIWSFVLLF